LTKKIFNYSNKEQLAKPELQRAEQFKSSTETFATWHTCAKKRIEILCGGR